VLFAALFSWSPLVAKGILGGLAKAFLIQPSGGTRLALLRCRWSLMATPSLRTISINFQFQNKTVVHVPDFTTSHALFNFDVVVVRPYTFPLRSVNGGSGGTFSVEWGVYAGANAEVESKIDDIARLLRQGGLLIVILDVVQILVHEPQSYTTAKTYRTSNYHFLDDRFFEVVRNGTGDRVKCDPSEPFAKVVKASIVRWTSFISDGIPYPFSNSTVFASNGANSIVGATVPHGAGHVVFLPNFKQLNEASFFEACLDYRNRSKGTPAPDWVPSVNLPGLVQAEQDIHDLDLEIAELQQERLQKQTAFDALLGYKKLLFEKGKTQLEPIVLKSLNDLGFRASPAEVIPGTNFEIDGRTAAGSAPGVLEVKGSKNQIPLDEFSPFTTKILADFQATNVHSKGILVGNGLCLEMPNTRLGSGVFSPHVLDAAKRNSVALVNSVELYATVCNLFEGRINDLEAIRETILTANGYADLTRFIVTSPFPTK
jgi:hypothetical protein